MAGKCYSEIGFGKYSTSLENNGFTLNIQKVCQTIFRIRSLLWAHYRWTRRKIFKIEVLRWLENTILRFVFAYTVETPFTISSFN